MSAEVAVKKRGRPKKAVVEDVEDVVERGSIAPTPRTRGKATVTAKKSSSTSTATLSPSTTSPSSKRRAKESVQDAGPAGDVESTAPIATKRKVAAVQSAKSSTATAASKVKLSPAVSKATPQSATVDGKSEAPPLERVPAQSKKRARGAGSSVDAPVSESSLETSPGGQEHLTALGSDLVIEVQHSRQAGSKILQQAQAFSTQSNELEGSPSELVDQRQAANHLDESTTTSANPSQTSQPTIQPPTAPQPTPIMPFGFRTTSTPQVRAYSSTSPLPMSTTLALAARQTANKLPPRPAGPPPPTEPRHPAPFQIPSEVPIGPRPPKLSEMPLEQRKKDPKYRKATIRYTAAIVAMPFLIVSSWMLWEKYQEHQLYLEKVREARAKAKVAVSPDPLARPASPTSTPLSHETK